MNNIGFSKKTVLSLVYVFILLALLSDIPIIVLYTFTGSASLAKILLYGSEAVILMIFAHLLLNSLLLNSSQMRLPVFIYIYTIYILLIMLVSLSYYDNYTVLRDSRKFLVPLPPLLLGYYFGLFFKEEQKGYITKLISFLTIMSVIGLIEWVWWYFSYDSIAQFYSRYFDIGSYYDHIRQTSHITESGMMQAAVRPSGFLIPGVIKRLTGLYFEPFAAGFNSTLAVILILYSRIAGYLKTRKTSIFLVINIVAAILTTSRSAYLLLLVSLFSYAIIQRKPFGLFLAGLLVFLYSPLKNLLITSVETLGGDTHKEAVFLFISYFSSHLLSLDGLLGSGVGSMEKISFSTHSGYGAIFGQLGFFGLLSLFCLYFFAMSRIPLTRENKFFVLSIAISTSVLLLFSGYPFGYKTYGLIYFFLGSIMIRPRAWDVPSGTVVWIKQKGYD